MKRVEEGITCYQYFFPLKPFNLEGKNDERIWLKTLHNLVLRSATSLRNSPLNVLVRHLDATAFTVNTVLWM